MYASIDQSFKFAWWGFQLAGGFPKFPFGAMYVQYEMRATRLIMSSVYPKVLIL